MVAAKSTALRAAGEAASASTTSITAIVAVLEATAETATVATLATRSWPSGGRPAMAASAAPIQRDRPLSWIPAAMAKPPPSSSSVSHGTPRSARNGNTGRPSARSSISASAAATAMPPSTCAEPSLKACT